MSPGGFVSLAEELYSEIGCAGVAAPDLSRMISAGVFEVEEHTFAQDLCLPWVLSAITWVPYTIFRLLRAVPFSDSSVRVLLCCLPRYQTVTHTLTALFLMLDLLPEA